MEKTSKKDERDRLRQDIYDFVVDYVKEHLYPPTIEEIRSCLNIKSKEKVWYQLNILEREGKVSITRETSRGIKLTGYRIVKE